MLVQNATDIPKCALNAVPNYANSPLFANNLANAYICDVDAALPFTRDYQSFKAGRG